MWGPSVRLIFLSRRYQGLAPTTLLNQEVEGLGKGYFRGETETVTVRSNQVSAP